MHLVNINLYNKVGQIIKYQYMFKDSQHTHTHNIIFLPYDRRIPTIINPFIHLFFFFLGVIQESTIFYLSVKSSASRCICLYNIHLGHFC